MKINLKNFLRGYILIIFLIIFVIFFLKNIIIQNNINLEIIMTFIVIATIIVLNVVTDKKKYSLNKIFWYFSFFFMFLAPLLQYVTGYNPWGHFLSDENMLKANYSLIIWFTLYAITYKIVTKKETNNINIGKINLKNSTLNFFIVCSFFAFGIALVLIGFGNLFLRGQNQTSFDTGFVNTVISNFIRTVPVYAISYAIYYYKKNNKLNIIKIIILIVLLMCLNYPVSLSRYWIGTVYIGIALIIFGKYLKNKTFDIGIIFVFAVIFPIFQVFKWYTLNDLITGTASVNLIEVYNNADFDAYSLFVRTFEYVETFGITYGKQLLTTVLFFIPRAIWPTKSIPTGELVATSQNQLFTNLSAPLQAEGLVNIGYIGIILYAIIVAYLTKKLDIHYWERENDGTRFIDYIYPFCIGLFIFLLRGSFHPVIVLSFTFFLFMIIWKIINFIKIKIKKLKE